MDSTVGLVNARIWTGVSRRPWAGSLLIQAGQLSAVDDERAARDAHIVIDAGGRFAAPGLIDTHTHLVMAGETLSQLDLSGVRSREEFEQAIAERHARLPKGEWLLAFGWSNENWGGAMPDKSWLRACGGRPAVAWRTDSHVCLVNDAVLAMCDLAVEPEGGRIGLTQSGEPDGMMYEAAAWRIVNPLIPRPDAQALQQALVLAQERAHQCGLTTVGSMEYRNTVESVYLPLRDRLTLRVRVTLLDRELPLDFSFAESFQNDDRLAIIGFKTFIDGTLGSRTARMLEPYADDAASGNRGMLCELAAEGRLHEWIETVAARGWQPSMHAIGDEAARLALDALDALSPEVEARVRPRIEHAQQLSLNDIPRFRGRIASMQPLHRADDGRYAERRVGRERLEGTFAFRKLADAGATLAFGSDWPIVSCDPIAGIRAAVTGLTSDGTPFQPHENLAFEEALRAYTAGSAFALRFEDRIGSIANGMLGDVVLFDLDPFEADWTDEPPRVILTIAGGRVVHDAR